MRRRDLLGLSLQLLLVPLAGAAAVLLARQRDLPERRTGPQLVPLPPDGGARCAGAVIVTAPAAGRLHALSSRCPHLGCRVDRVDGGELVCPCHGSRFALDGAVRRGPATQGLQELRWTPDPDRLHLRVEPPA